MTKIEHEDFSGVPTNHYVKGRKRRIPRPHEILKQFISAWFIYVAVTLTIFLTEEVVL